MNTCVCGLMGGSDPKISYINVSGLETTLYVLSKWDIYTIAKKTYIQHQREQIQCTSSNNNERLIGLHAMSMDGWM